MENMTGSWKNKIKGPHSRPNVQYYPKHKSRSKLHGPSHLATPPVCITKPVCQSQLPCVLVCQDATPMAAKGAGPREVSLADREKVLEIGRSICLPLGLPFLHEYPCLCAPQCGRQHGSKTSSTEKEGGWVVCLGCSGWLGGGWFAAVASPKDQLDHHHNDVDNNQNTCRCKRSLRCGVSIAVIFGHKTM